MFTLEIGKEIRTFDGRVISVDATMKPMTIKDVLLHYIGTFNTKDGKRLIEAYKLGLKLSDYYEQTINIENSDWLIIQEAIQTPVHGALIMGQLQEAIEAAEKTKK